MSWVLGCLNNSQNQLLLNSSMLLEGKYLKLSCSYPRFLEPEYGKEQTTNYATVFYSSSFLSRMLLVVRIHPYVLFLCLYLFLYP